MKEVTFESFDAEVGNSNVPVLVKFWAEWCQPCKMLKPTLERLATAYGDQVKFVQVDADSESAIVSLLHISSLPTLIIYKDGKPVQTLIGLQSEKSLKAALDSHL